MTRCGYTWPVVKGAGKEHDCFRPEGHSGEHQCMCHAKTPSEESERQRLRKLLAAEQAES